MNSQIHQSSCGAVRQRAEAGLKVHRVEPVPRVATHMRNRFGSEPRHYANRARPDDPRGDPSACAPLKAVIDPSNDFALHVTGMRIAQGFVSLASVSCTVSTHKAADRGSRIPLACRYPCNQGPEATRSSE